MKLLIVDDNTQIRDLIKKIILKTPMKFEFAESSDGEDAVNQFIKEKPDLITMDILMDKMDGLESIKKIKSLSGKVKIIVISQLPEEEFKQEALNAGAIEFLNKENLIQLPGLITRLLNE